MSILVYLENAGAELPKGALCTIAAALQAKSAQGHDKAVGLILGNEGADAAANVAAAYGLDEVLYVQNAGLDPYLAIPHAEAIVAAAQECGASLVIGLSSTRGKDVMPRVAQVLDAGQASDVLEFLSEGKFKRPMYAGDIIATVEITTDKKVTTVRQTAFDPAEKSGSSCSVRALQVALSGTDAQKFVAFDTVESERPELTEADIVVSGGRAMKSEENFEKYIAPLADALDAAIGASRAAVDSGYAPNDWQVGQTGKVVAPNLYIAIGISGAIQHLAGMKDSKVIVAINKDPEAPIFEVADYGLVADLYQAVPELTEAIKSARG